MPPLPLTSWVPRRAPSSANHLPPVLFPLALLWPVLALTCQPFSVLPSKMATKPSSTGLSFLSAANEHTANVAVDIRMSARRNIIAPLKGVGDSKLVVPFSLCYDPQPGGN